MAVKIGAVQMVRSGWGFTLKDSTAQPARYLTLTYSTEAEANTARAQIEATTANAIDAKIA